MHTHDNNRVWHSGPPPHPGWWNASKSCRPDLWSWWNGPNDGWSIAVLDTFTAIAAAKYADSWAMDYGEEVKWTDYYPENARVPRIDARGFVAVPRLIIHPGEIKTIRTGEKRYVLLDEIVNFYGLDLFCCTFFDRREYKQHHNDIHIYHGCYGGPLNWRGNSKFVFTDLCDLTT